MTSAWHPPPSLADLGEFPRLERFRAAHPEWRIGYDHDHRFWQGRAWQDGEETTAVRYLLADLLDRLDVLAAPDPGG